MDQITSCCKVDAFYRLFFAKERRKTMKGKPDGNLQVDFSLYARFFAGVALPIMFVLEGFYDHIIDSDMEQGADGLCFLREPVLQ